MTLNLIEKGIEIYRGFSQKRLSESKYRELKQNLTQTLYLLLNSRGKEQLDDAIKKFMEEIEIEEIIGQIDSRPISRQNQHHAVSIALSLLCIASR